MAHAVHFCKMLHFMLVLLLPILATAQPNRNVSLGSSLIANNENLTWLSPSGDFAFGFQQVVPGGGYLLAIWFNKIPERTIVWSANRDNLAEQVSKIQLLADGRFELDDPRGQRIWSADVGSSSVAYGAMLDTGDFVLAINSSAFSWQSFDNPIDTILHMDGRLLSSFSETNYSSGRFVFLMQNDGNLLSNTRNFPMDDMIGSYWATMTMQHRVPSDLQ